MDSVILANQQSEVEKMELKNGSKDLQYATATPYPILGKSYKNYKPRIPFSGTPDSKSVTFDVIPGYFNHLSRFRFDYDLAVPAGANFATGIGRLPIGFLIIDYIRISDNGVQLQEISGAAYRALVHNLPAHKRDYIMRYARPLKEGDVAGALVDDNPNEGVYSFAQLLTSWYTGSAEKSINTSVVQTLQIEIRFKSMAQVGLPANAITNFKCSLDMRYWKPEDKIYRELLDKNYTNPLSMECFDTYTEVVQLDKDLATDAEEPHKVDLSSKCPYFCFKSIAFIAKNTMTTASVMGCPFLKISSLSMDVGGSPYILDYTRSQMELEGVMNGMRDCGIVRSLPAAVAATGIYTGPLVVCDSAPEIYPIDWSMIGSENSNTGGAFFSKLNNPKFSFKFRYTPLDGENSGEYALYVVHFYWRNNVISQGYINSYA